MRCEDFSQKKTVIDFIKLLDPDKYDNKTSTDIITELSKYSKDKNNEYYKNTSCNIMHKLLRIKDKKHAKKRQKQRDFLKKITKKQKKRAKE